MCFHEFLEARFMSWKLLSCGKLYSKTWDDQTTAIGNTNLVFRWWLRKFHATNLITCKMVVATFLYNFDYLFLSFLSKNTVPTKAFYAYKLSSVIQAENFSAKRSDFRVIVRRFLLLVRQSETDAKRDRISLVVVGTASPFGSISLDHININFLKSSYCL